MKFNLIFLPDFFNDLKQAVDWYEDQQTGYVIITALFHTSRNPKK